MNVASDPVLLAVLAMVREWGTEFIKNWAANLTAIGVLGGVVLTWWNGRRAKQGQAVLTATVAGVSAQVDEVRVQAAATTEEKALIASGAFRQGHVAGVRIAEERAKSDVAPLGPK